MYTLVEFLGSAGWLIDIQHGAGYFPLSVGGYHADVPSRQIADNKGG